MNVTHIKAVTIVKTVHRDKTTYAFRLGRWQYPMACIRQYVKHFPMAPHAHVIAKLQGHAHHPYTTQQMIGMGMCDKEVMNTVIGYACPFQLYQNAVAAASIDKQQRPSLAMKSETGVIASGNKCAARSQHSDIVICLHVICHLVLCHS